MRSSSSPLLLFYSSTPVPFPTMRSLVTLALLALPFVSAKPASFTRTCSNHGKGSKTPLVSAAWYAGWHSDDFPLDAVSWNKYTHMTYSFASVFYFPGRVILLRLLWTCSETTPDVHVLSLNGSNPEVLPNFVETAHKNVCAFSTRDFRL